MEPAIGDRELDIPVWVDFWYLSPDDLGAVLFGPFLPVATVSVPPCPDRRLGALQRASQPNFASTGVETARASRVFV